MTDEILVDNGKRTMTLDELGMTQPGLAVHLGEAARTAAHARYSFDRMVAAFDALYTAQLSRRGVAVGEHLELADS